MGSLSALESGVALAESFGISRDELASRLDVPLLREAEARA
jgi:hypothetical protein